MSLNLSSDQFNALLALSGACFLLPSIFEAYKKKLVVGIHWSTPLFFTSWSLWNIWYFHSLDQPYSTVGALSMFIVDIVWLGLILKYRDKTQ